MRIEDREERPRRRLLIVLVVLAVLAVPLVLQPGGSQREPPGPVSPVAVAERGAPLARRQLPARRDAGATEGRGRRDTVVDGSLPVDADGHLVAAPDVLRIFDYFFIDSGEVDDAIIRRRIETAIEARLGEPARGEALALLADYLEYRAAAARLFAEGGDAPLVERIAAIEELRRDAFGELAESLFDSDLAYARVAAELHDVSVAPDLSEDERAARIEELAAQLPGDVRAVRERATAPLALARDEAELRASGAGQEEIRALREDRFGAEAADRLAALDRQRAGWRQRVDEFRRQRSAIEADPGLTAAQRNARLDELLSDSFDPTERKRVEALDRIELGR